MNRSVILSLAGISISVYSENQLIIEMTRYAFKGFAAPDEKPLIKVKVVIDDDIKDTNAYSYGRPHHTNVIIESGRFFSKASTYKGIFDINSLTAELRQGVSVAPVYLFLRFILSVYLPLVDGFILHSNSIVKDKSCFLFSGRPQSGKSTVAKLSADYQVLSDDFSVVRRMNGSFCGFGSPFWGHVEARGENIKNKVGCVPIKGVYFLKQDNEVYAQKLNKKEAVLQVIQNIAVLAKTKIINAKVIRLADEFTDKVPVNNLHFRQDNTFWRCIEND